MLEMFTQQAMYVYCRTTADCYSIGTCHGSGQYLLGHMDYTLLVRCIALNVYSFVACTCPLLSIHISEKLAPSRVPEETHARKYLVLQGSLFQD